MDIVGKYLFAKLEEGDFWRTLGAEISSDPTDRLWLLAGTGMGENAYGLWIRIQAVYTPEDKDFTPPELSDSITFVRWTHIQHIMAYDEKPSGGAPKIGFQPR